MPIRRSSSLTFRYLPYKYHGRLIKLPAVHVRLSYSNDPGIRSFALVDSGATASFLPLELADILDCRFTGKIVHSEGAGGLFETRKTALHIELLVGEKQYWSKKADFLVPVEERRIPYVVLGRDALFKAYDITFCENRQRTVFRKAG